MNNTNNKYKMNVIKVKSESHPIEFHDILKSLESKFSQLSNILKNLNEKSQFKWYKTAYYKKYIKDTR